MNSHYNPNPLAYPNPNSNQVALALALSFVNMGLRSLVVRADTLHRLLERLKDKLPVWMRPREAGGGGGDPSDRRHTYICMHPFLPPHTSLTPPSNLPQTPSVVSALVAL